METVPILTFRSRAPEGPNGPRGEGASRGREVAYLVIVPALALTNLALGLAILALARHESGWKGVLLLLAGALSCALGGWLAGASWLRYYWRARMQRQLRIWTSIVDSVTGWEDEVGVSPDAALRLKRRLDGLMTKL
jgi:hypothetical protein